MPYAGDLVAERVQRFETIDDLDRADVTIEEREEYEHHIGAGIPVFVGVDYGAILEQVEAEWDVLLFDGGNNDLSFYRPTVHLVVADPLRSGDEARYHPGEANVRMADAVLINKVNVAEPADVHALEASIRTLNPTAPIIHAASRLEVDDADAISGKRVLVVEDGPTLTHGGMKYGAGVVAAREHGAAEIVDPRPYAEGTLAEVFDRYDVGPVLPAEGLFGRAATRAPASDRRHAGGSGRDRDADRSPACRQDREAMRPCDLPTRGAGWPTVTQIHGRAGDQGRRGVAGEVS